MLSSDRRESSSVYSYTCGTRLRPSINASNDSSSNSGHDRGRGRSRGKKKSGYCKHISTLPTIEEDDDLSSSTSVSTSSSSSDDSDDMEFVSTVRGEIKRLKDAYWSKVQKGTAQLEDRAAYMFQKSQLRRLLEEAQLQK